MKKIIILGDSLVYGHWDEQGGFAQRMKNEVSKEISKNYYKNYKEVYYFGIPGLTTEGLAKRVEGYLKTVINDGDKVMIIISIGINDSCRRVNLADFRANIKKIIEVPKQHTSFIFWLGLPRVDESSNWVQEVGFMNSKIEEFDDELRNTVSKVGVAYLDWFDIEDLKRLDFLAEDGAHPSSLGHAFIYKRLMEVLQDEELPFELG